MKLSDICAKLKKKPPQPHVYSFPNTPHHVDCPVEVLPSVQKLPHAHLYKLSLCGVDLEITFYTAAKTPPPSAIDRVLRILQFLLPHRQCDLPAYQFNIYWSDHTKVLPKTGILGWPHVNTGISYHCEKQLVVFRQEEWTKVFIHECFHYFNMDIDLGVDARVQKAYHSVTQIELCEAYCEIWARILHCCLVSVLCPEKLADLLNVERDFAYFQTVKVLDYAGTTYEAVIQGKCRNYREKTMVFAYYAVTCAILHRLEAFPLSFKDHSFAEFVLECYDDPTLLKKLKEKEAYVAQEKAADTALYKTTRMTITDMCLEK